MISRSMMMALAGVLVVTACGETGADLVVTDTVVFAPLPGRTTSVAYLAIENLGRQPVTVTGISSPQFGRVELHETVMNNGVARMRALPPPVIEANGVLEFKRGGKHVMLFEPGKALAPGQPVALHVRFASDVVLIVETTLKNRIATESGR